VSEKCNTLADLICMQHFHPVAYGEEHHVTGHIQKNFHS